MRRNYRTELLEILDASRQLIEQGEEEPENWSECLTAFFILLAQVCSHKMTPHEFVGSMEIAKHAVLKDHMDI
jgi:hypothetical protein